MKQYGSDIAKGEQIKADRAQRDNYIGSNTGRRIGPTIENANALGYPSATPSNAAGGYSGKVQYASSGGGTNGDGRSPAQKYLDSTEIVWLGVVR